MSTAELESVAEFSRRASALGVSAANVEKLAKAGFDTFGKYAFSVPYNPSSSDETPLRDMLKASLGSDPDAGQLACLRRLFWESHALALADLRYRQEHGSEGVAKKLPTAERVHRAKEQKSRLQGLVWGPDSEPSDQLVDRFVQMSEDNVVTYVKPELCTSRSQEVTHIKDTKGLALNADGSLKLASQESNLRCATTGELKLRATFHRKALALDLSGIMTFGVVEQWRVYLFTMLQRESPPGYKSISIGQLLEADKRLWVLLSEETRGNVAGRPGSAPPCDSVFKKLTESQDVLSFLTPLPMPPPVPTGPRFEPYNGKGKGGKTSDKGKKGNGKAPSIGDGKGANLDLPEGARAHTEEGKPSCFGFNRNKCYHSKKVKPGKRCPRGFHKCWICLRDKPATECTHSD